MSQALVNIGAQIGNAVVAAHMEQQEVGTLADRILRPVPGETATASVENGPYHHAKVNQSK